MISFVLGISIALNVIFIVGIIVYINVKKNMNSLKDIVKDVDMFKDFYR